MRTVPDIVIRGLCKRYGEKAVLRNFDAVLPQGALTCLMAPSGAGKTTLLRLLLGLEKPDGGEIAGLDGLHLAAVFQEDRLIESLSAQDNVRLVNLRVSKDAVRAAFAAVRLADCAGQPVRELSGGMRRRVAIVRALLAEWDVLFLDEPFKGLDGETKAAVLDFVRRSLRGRTALLVTHDRAEAEALGAAQFLALP